MSIEKGLQKQFPDAQIHVSMDGRGIVTLTGICGSWNELVKIGHKAAKEKGVYNVVNKMTVKGMVIPRKDYSAARTAGRQLGVTAKADVVIIGAGISGCGIARELSKYNLKTILIEMSDDVATGATKSNNGNIHPGYAAKPGTLKAKLNVEGNRMYTDWAEQLGFDLQRVGAMGYVTDNVLKLALHAVMGVCKKNGVPAELVDGKRAGEIEPGLKANGMADKIKLAIWMPTMGLVEPYQVAVALAENAAENGVKFWFDCTAADILHENGKVTGVLTNKGIIEAPYVINCAGIYADDLSAMAGDECFTLHPRKGVIAILDKGKKPETRALCSYLTKEGLKLTIQNMKKETKGGGMCHTPEGNILMGPSAIEVPDKEDKSTDAQSLSYAMGRGNENIQYGDVIRFFAGSRPADYKEDFFIEMSPVTDGFINVAGIQSPGLASAPAIAKMVEGILKDHMNKNSRILRRKPDWNPIRKKKPEFRNLSREEQDQLIKENPAYGRVICRCETITEGEILEAIHSPVPPTSVDGIKRRTRAGMGRCQGGFCQPRVLEILAREQNRQLTDITLKGKGSNILVGGNRPQAGKEEQA